MRLNLAVLACMCMWCISNKQSTMTKTILNAVSVPEALGKNESITLTQSKIFSVVVFHLILHMNKVFSIYFNLLSLHRQCAFSTNDWCTHLPSPWSCLSSCHLHRPPQSSLPSYLPSFPSHLNFFSPLPLLSNNPIPRCPASAPPSPFHFYSCRYLCPPPALKDDRFQMVLFTPRLVRITLTNVSVTDEGGYFCQLYTDATHHQVATLSVSVPPETPTVEVKQEAMEGGEVELTCMSPRSKPAATLRWIRNGREIPGTWLTMDEWMVWWLWEINEEANGGI